MSTSDSITFIRTCVTFSWSFIYSLPSFVIAICTFSRAFCQTFLRTSIAFAMSFTETFARSLDCYFHHSLFVLSRLLQGSPRLSLLTLKILFWRVTQTFDWIFHPSDTRDLTMICVSESPLYWLCHSHSRFTCTPQVQR